jgi:hypothetical protein
MAWQGTLAQMRTHGTRVAQACTTSDCRRWVDLDIEKLIAELGPEHMLWDRRPPCPLCDGKTHFMASPGPSTPYRPLLGGIVANEVKRAFLKSFGFTPRDVRRIQAVAEATTKLETPASLDDLDVPFRVGACMPGREGYSTGKILGEWAGRSLLYWPMNDREQEVWERSRRRGPKLMPSTPKRRP